MSTESAPETDTIDGAMIATEAAADNPSEKPRRSGIIATLTVGGAFILKFLKPLFIGLKTLKLAAVLKTGLTMVLSMWAYALAWGWAYGVAFVLLILVHEMGHVYALREFGVKAGAPVFIPFVGAFIAMKEQPQNVRVEAWTAIYGPLVGTGGAMLCWSAALYTGSSFMMAVAYTGFFLNLFNLIPISPLDGGRVVAALSPKIWIFGFIGILIMFFRSYNPILFFILLPAGRNVYELWKNRKVTPSEYFEVDNKTKIQISLLYFGLLGFLAVAMSLTHVAR